ncbi:MAG: PQQ-dependent sugar dehydrogenase [Phycisphaerales bacterium]
MPRRHHTTNPRAPRAALPLLILAATTHAAPCEEPITNPYPPLEPIGITIKLENIVSGLPISRTPTDVATIPDGSGRMLIATLGGEIMLLKPDNSFTLFLDTRNENTQVNLNQFGCTSIAIHPGFADPESPGFGRLYTITTENKNARPFQYGVPNDHLDIISEWQVDPTNPDIADPATEREILVIAQRSLSHNMTDTLFLPDETLLISLGDSGNTPPTVISVPILAQQLNSIFGKAIRIDPLGLQGTPGPNDYSIPNDNPFAGTPGALKEIYALGLRSPYKLTTDPLTGDIFTGNVGQDSIESVFQINPAENYGWPEREGSFQFDKQTHEICYPDPPNPAFTPPITEYDRSEGRSVTAGPVYRGADIPELDNHLLIADFTGPIVGGGNTARLFAFDRDSANLGVVTIDTACGPPLPELLFAVETDATGEILILGRSLAGTGRIDRIRPAGPETLPADINNDGQVNSDDLAILLSAFGTTGPDLPSDINNDDKVNSDDLAILLSTFGQSANPC